MFFNNVALGHSISLLFFVRYTLTICDFFFIYNVNIGRYISLGYFLVFSQVKQSKVFLISFFSNLNYILPTHCSCSSFFLYLLSDEKWFFCLSASLLILFLSNPLILDAQERKRGKLPRPVVL